jgi:hypothetical protein
MPGLTLEHEGSRYEVKGVRTLAHVIKAMWLMSRAGVPKSSEFHCYLSGGSFTIWAEWKGPDDA